MIDCDNRSVGILVWRDDRLLTIKRARKPFGYAPPAGHVDERATFEIAAQAELQEEVGLSCGRLELLLEGRLDNRCRRPHGLWHYWKIYRAEDISGEIRPSEKEVKDVAWLSRAELTQLADSALRGEDMNRLEPAWAYWLSRLAIIDLTVPQLTAIEKLL